MCHVFVSTVFRYVKPYMRLHNVEVWYFLNQTGFLGKDLAKLHELKMLYLPVLFDFEHCWRNRCCSGYNVAQWTIVQEKKKEMEIQVVV